MLLLSILFLATLHFKITKVIISSFYIIHHLTILNISVIKKSHTSLAGDLSMISLSYKHAMFEGVDENSSIRSGKL